MTRADTYYLILSPSQINDWETVCWFKRNYPWAQIVAQQTIPLTGDTRRRG